VHGNVFYTFVNNAFGSGSKSLWCRRHSPLVIACCVTRCLTRVGVRPGQSQYRFLAAILWKKLSAGTAQRARANRGAESIFKEWAAKIKIYRGGANRRLEVRGGVCSRSTAEEQPHTALDQWPDGAPGFYHWTAYADACN